MTSATHLYDLLESHWETFGEGFAAVWSEGISVKETALRLGADINSAAERTFADIALGFEGDDMPGDDEGIILVGNLDRWTLTLQIQWADVAEIDRLLALSRDGGRAIAVSWHSDSDHLVECAKDGKLVFSGPMEDALDPLREYSAGLRMPTDWDIPASQGEPTEEMITTAFVAIGRMVGREIDDAWLRTPHVRYLIRRTGKNASAVPWR
ncbi:hypothetical protein GCM10010156_74300 [Planobispora rosea]|uniref:Uncharacterized protein n=1 Tax=Planobispora rosea TaxID=35762 RepID=A0A8J3SFY6_PLARO|nr:hypothetical protein [Planobispora rosea]GGT05751.1 hypothetical protein GCM10010156_74300 [Planobispora rosea]GIH88978.1 hypothetical protein Pro02_73860 [Planobispora rosea]